MKKLLSVIIALAAALSMTACSGDTASGGNTPDSGVNSADQQGGTPSGSDAGSGEAQLPDGGPAETEPAEETKLLSNEIPLTADGDIDMTAALAYETDVEALIKELGSRETDPSKPVSRNSNEDTLAVFDYLYSIYGKQILTCQQMMNTEAYEDLVYYNGAHDLPAMKGFDFIFCTGSYVSEDMINDAIAWHNESGGLVTFTWHWNVPTDVDKAGDPDCRYAFYTEEITNWSALNAVTPGTKEYEIVIHDIDLIATKLQRMESEGITVLFRPLHEASGAWFWWGLQDRSTAENEIFQKLWYIIYDRIENHHKLTNIIWVWNGQSQFCAVSPNAYDIAGIDYYASSEDHSAMRPQYDNLKNLSDGSGKMLALSECGYIPDPAECAATDTYWLYYMIWNGDFVYAADASGKAITDLRGTPSPNTERMTNEMLEEYFGSDVFITRSKLPDRFISGKDIPQKIKNWEFFS